MREKTVLYLGNDCAAQRRLGSHLQDMGIALSRTSSVEIAKQKLCERPYSLLMIQFEHTRSHIFDICKFARHENHDSIILVLMEETMPLIESTLFDCGVDDVVAGKQGLPMVLKSRIKRRLFNGRPLLPDACKFMLTGRVFIDLERKEVQVNQSRRRLKGISGKLLMYFLENPHRVISREELIKSPIWDSSVCPPDRIEGGKAVDMAVTRLRRIIEPDASNPQILLTVYGTGWMLAKDAVW